MTVGGRTSGSADSAPAISFHHDCDRASHHANGVARRSKRSVVVAASSTVVRMMRVMG